MREQLDPYYIYAIKDLTTIYCGHRTVYASLQKSGMGVRIRLYAESSWEKTVNNSYTVDGWER